MNLNRGYVASYDTRPGSEVGLHSFRAHKRHGDIQGGPKSKPLPNDQKIVLNRIKAFQ